MYFCNMSKIDDIINNSLSEANETAEIERELLDSVEELRRPEIVPNHFKYKLMWKLSDLKVYQERHMPVYVIKDYMHYVQQYVYRILEYTTFVSDYSTIEFVTTYSSLKDSIKDFQVTLEPMIDKTERNDGLNAYFCFNADITSGNQYFQLVMNIIHAMSAYARQKTSNARYACYDETKPLRFSFYIESWIGSEHKWTQIRGCDGDHLSKLITVWKKKDIFDKDSMNRELIPFSDIYNCFNHILNPADAENKKRSFSEAIKMTGPVDNYGEMYATYLGPYLHLPSEQSWNYEYIPNNPYKGWCLRKNFAEECPDFPVDYHCEILTMQCDMPAAASYLVTKMYKDEPYTAPHNEPKIEKMVCDMLRDVAGKQPYQVKHVEIRYNKDSAIKPWHKTFINMGAAWNPDPDNLMHEWVMIIIDTEFIEYVLGPRTTSGYWRT